VTLLRLSRGIAATAIGVAALVSAAPSSAASLPPASARPSVYVLPGDTTYPEGIAVDRSTSAIFTGGLLDGTVYKGHLNQSQLKVFLPAGTDGRTSAVGMTVDTRGRLYIAGGATGTVWVYRATTGKLLGTFTNGLGSTETFLNDLTIAPNGDVFVTDSASPTLWRIPRQALAHGGATSGNLAAWRNLEGTPLTYVQGFNANGIVVSPDRRGLLVVNSATGGLFRIDLRSRRVKQVDLGGATLINGDGMLLRCRTLTVVRNADRELVQVRLSASGGSGRIMSARTDPSFAFPTTIAAAAGRFLVVNSQFDKGGPAGPGTPVTPFTISSVPIRP
jgi:streptogramin lyase